MASCGASGPGRRGGTCRSGMARGRRCTAGSGAGGRPGSGIGSSRRSNEEPTRPGRWTGASTSSMAASFARTSTPLVQRGGAGNRGAGAQPGRLLDQGAPQGRGPGQAAHRPAHSWSTARSDRLRAADAAGLHPSSRSRAAAPSPLPCRRRQGLHWPPPPRRPPTSGHPPHHPEAQHRAPLRPLRSRHLPPSPPGREPDRPLQAVPRPRHPLRQAGRLLPRRLGDGHDYPLAPRIAFAYRP
jgi:hypothetical protein